MTAKQERRRLKEFFISLLVNTNIEIIFPNIPGTPTMVLKLLINTVLRGEITRHNKIIHSPSGLPPASRSTDFPRSDLSDQSHKAPEN